MENKRITKKQKGSVSINMLPNELLVNILSRLPFKEAARTSVLSHDWKNLWKYYGGCIDIEVTELEPETEIETPRIITEAVMKIKRARNQRRYLKACKNRDLVNQILLKSHRAPSVQGLRISVDLDDNCEPSFDRWIEFAIRKRVQSLELDLAPLVQRVPDRFMLNEVFYIFPGFFFELHHHSYPSRSFDTLTSLKLKCVHVSEQDLSYFLSDNCPLLQDLSLDGIPRIYHICVFGRPTLKLRNLEILECPLLRVVKVVSAPKLVSLRYEGFAINMFLENVPRLSSVTLGDDYPDYLIPNLKEELPSCIFSQVERLVLDIPPAAMRRKRDQIFPEFRNLKELEVTLKTYNHNCMFFIAFYVHASPILCKLAVKYNIKRDCKISSATPWHNEDGLDPPKCWHDSLKVVELMGWVGLETDYLFARYLCEISASLEKMIIDPHNPFDVKKTPIDPCLLEAARESATLLSTQLPKGAGLIIL